MDDPKNNVLSSNINHHPGTVRVFCITWKNDDWPEMERMVLNIPLKVFVKLKHIITPKILLYLFA